MTVEAAFDNNELWQRQLWRLLFISREPHHPGQIWDQASNIKGLLILLFSELVSSSFLLRNIFLTEWRGFSDRHLKCSYFPLTYSIHRNLSSLGQIMLALIAQRWMRNDIKYCKCKSQLHCRYSSQNVKSNFTLRSILKSSYMLTIHCVQIDLIGSSFQLHKKEHKFMLQNPHSSYSWVLGPLPVHRWFPNPEQTRSTVRAKTFSQQSPLVLKITTLLRK